MTEYALGSHFFFLPYKELYSEDRVQKLHGELFTSLKHHCLTVRGYFLINWWSIKSIKIMNSSKSNRVQYKPTSSTPLEV